MNGVCRIRDCTIFVLFLTLPVNKGLKFAIDDINVNIKCSALIRAVKSEVIFAVSCEDILRSIECCDKIATRYAAYASIHWETTHCQGYKTLQFQNRGKIVTIMFCAFNFLRYLLTTTLQHKIQANITNHSKLYTFM